MAKDSVEFSKYETLFRKEVALFERLRQELNNAKTKTKRDYLEKKVAKQKGRALGLGMKIAQLKELKKLKEESIKDEEE